MNKRIQAFALPKAPPKLACALAEGAARRSARLSPKTPRPQTRSSSRRDNPEANLKSRQPKGVDSIVGGRRGIVLGGSHPAAGSFKEGFGRLSAECQPNKVLLPGGHRFLRV